VTKTASINITLTAVPQLELLPGWNLVTLPKQLENTSSGIQKFLALRPITLDADNHCYIQCNHEADVKTGMGYWIFSNRRETVELSQNISQTVSLPELKSGWNLVGFLEDSDWATSDVEVWSWRNSRFVYIDKQDLQIGQAYWVFR